MFQKNNLFKCKEFAFEMRMPGVGLAVIIMSGKKVLLGKRKNVHGEGTWAFPGGHLEKYENFKDCALREVKEETGLDVSVVDENPVAVTNDFFPEDDKHYVTLFFRANYEGTTAPQNIELHKCEGWEWYFWDNLPELLMVPVVNLLKQNYNPFEQK